MFDTISLEGLLMSLSSLAPNNKRWLAEHLLEQINNAKEDVQTPDEKFMSEFFALPYDNPMTAEEKKNMIRSSRQTGITRIINYPSVQSFVIRI